NFQVFANGKMLEGCSWPSITDALQRVPVWCPLGNTPVPEPRTLVLAVRVWHWPRWAGYYSGGLRGEILVGGIAQIQEYAQLNDESRAWRRAKNVFLVIL